ncbi:protein kinase domain-containing protein [Desulfohalovibrio reitneri]|uniref:protein kinase domain-containing protein n=1 Tax=Desulfohalovibrio reitneri TaxID=1307759 RepID=UPI0004A733DE|nr:protein kinase [Desulfohalovibrio reitneri]
MNIGKYRVAGLLGAGGMGRVYKAVLPVAGRVVALKRLMPDETLEMLWGEDAVERLFLDEARVLGRLRHPRIASVLDCDRDEAGRPFYTMEYFCANLGSMLAESYQAEEPSRVLPPPWAARLGREVLDGVGRLHQDGVLHRDLKPFNVMLDDEGRARLIDFGLHRVRGERWESPRGVAIGTPFYTAPEQEADPDAAGPEADLYSVGVMLWRMLTGALPDENPAARTPPSAANPGLFEAFDAVLTRAVAPDPGRRYADAGAMAGELYEALTAWEQARAGHCELPPEPGGAEGPARPAPRSRPSKISKDEARVVLGLDALRHPWPPPAPDPLDNGDGTVTDRATGLTWERGVSPHTLQWDEAADWAGELNRQGLGGHGDWRVPTASELAGLLLPAAGVETLCLDPVFAPARGGLWSADRATFTKAWFADPALGCIDRADMDCLRSVRCVRGGEP